MIITQPGRVTDRITLLGRTESCLYLVQGQGEAIVAGGGMAHTVPDLIRQLDNLDMDEHRISRICILHAHFDHCGAVPYLKQRWPWAKVTASARAEALFSKPQVMQGIIEMNQRAIRDAGCEAAFQQSGAFLKDIRIDETLGEGDVIPCGDIHFKVLEVPGHSSCSIALYMSEEKALFASDALGLKIDGQYQPTPNSNYDQYQHSLDKMAQYRPDVILMEHFGAYLGDDAHAFIPQAIKMTADHRRMLETVYLKTRDVDACTREVVQMQNQRTTDNFLPEEVRAVVAAQMVRFIAKTIAAKDSK